MLEDSLQATSNALKTTPLFRRVIELGRGYSSLPPMFYWSRLGFRKTGPIGTAKVADETYTSKYRMPRFSVGLFGATMFFETAGKSPTFQGFFLPWYIAAGSGAAAAFIIVLAAIFAMRRVLFADYLATMSDGRIESFRKNSQSEIIH